MFAAGEGNTDAARLLLEFGAKLNERSKGGYTPLLFAVRNNRYETVTFLLEQGANVNDKIPDGTSALSMAILNADFDLAAMLLDSGADPNAPDPRGHPLHVVVWLHQPGAPPDFAMNGEDPQPVPRPRGKLSHLDMAKKLLAKGADPNATITWGDRRFNTGGLARNPTNLNIGRHYLTYQGATPFYLAARNGDEPMMRVLVAGGADPLRSTRFGVTPLMAAACLDYYEGETAGPFSGVPESQRLEAVKLALTLGNKINARTTFGDYKMIGTPEDTLLRYPDNFQELLDLGTGDPRFAEMTALHGAVICNQPSIVKYLIEQGAEVNAKNRLGWTPLMIAGGLYIANAHKTSPGPPRFCARRWPRKASTAAEREPDSARNRSGERIAYLERFELPEIAVVRVQRTHAVLEEDGRNVRIRHEVSAHRHVRGDVIVRLHESSPAPTRLSRAAAPGGRRCCSAPPPVPGCSEDARMGGDADVGHERRPGQTENFRLRRAGVQERTGRVMPFAGSMEARGGR